MKWMKFWALFLGVFIGGFGAAFFLDTHPMNVLAAVIASEEEYTESDVVAEHGVVNEETATTSLVEPASVIETSILPASATSTNAVKVPVLVYHSVRPYIKGESKQQDIYDVTPELLESELVYIRDHGYTTITFADVITHFGNGASLPEKPVILSFDDGWRNEYEHAFPLLKKYGMKGTFFIFTNPIVHHKAHWVTWNEVREMDKAGMEIGGHTRTHPLLTKITSDAGLDKEIGESKGIIESEIGHPVTAFAYPFGAKNVQIEHAVERAGYQIARTSRSGVWNDPAHRFEFHGSLSTDNISDFEKLLKRE